MAPLAINRPDYPPASFFSCGEDGEGNPEALEGSVSSENGLGPKRKGLSSNGIHFQVRTVSLRGFVYTVAICYPKSCDIIRDFCGEKNGNANLCFLIIFYNDLVVVVIEKGGSKGETCGTNTGTRREWKRWWKCLPAIQRGVTSFEHGHADKSITRTHTHTDILMTCSGN